MLSTQFSSFKNSFSNEVPHTICFLGLPGAPVKFAAQNFKRFCQNEIKFFNTDELVAKYFSKASFSEVVYGYPESIWREIESLLVTALLKQTNFFPLDASKIDLKLLTRLTNSECKSEVSSETNFKISSDLELIFAPIMHLTSKIKRIVILGSGTANVLKEFKKNNKNNSVYCVIVDLDMSSALRNSLSVGGAIRIGRPRALWIQMAKNRLKEIESLADYRIDGERLLSAL